MNSISNKNKLPYLYVFIVFCMTFNAVNYWPLFGISSICIFLGILLPILICPSFYRTKQFWLLVLYTIIVVLNNISGDEYFDNRNYMLNTFIGFYVSLSISYYVLTKNNIGLIHAIINTLFIVLLWTTIATAIFDYSYPGIVRMLHSAVVRGGNITNEANIQAYKFYYAMGLSSFSLPHALPLMIPPFVLGLKNKSLTKSRRIFSGVMLLCCLLLIYYSGAMGPLLVAIMILILSFIVHKGNVSSNLLKILFIAIIFIPFIVNDQNILAILEWADDLLGGEGYFHSKVIDIQDTIIYGEASGDIEGRQDLYSNSINTFIENPLNMIIGAQRGFGGHSVIIDRLASLGLVGFVPFVCLIIIQLKFLRKYIDSKYLVYYSLSIISGFMLLISKNYSGWNMWFFFFAALPFCVVFFSDDSFYKV